MKSTGIVPILLLYLCSIYAVIASLLFGMALLSESLLGIVFINSALREVVILGALPLAVASETVSIIILRFSKSTSLRALVKKPAIIGGVALLIYLIDVCIAFCLPFLTPGGPGP